MIPSYTIASGNILDSQRISYDTIVAGTETVIPVYAFVPRYAFASGIDAGSATARGPVTRFDWYIAGSSTVTALSAGATITIKAYYGTVPGTGTAFLAGGYTFTLPMDATQGFTIRLSMQSTNDPSGTSAVTKWSTELVANVSAGTGAASTVTTKVFYGSTPSGSLAADTYMWLTFTGGSAVGSSAILFVDPRSVMCVAHGLQPQSLER